MVLFIFNHRAHPSLQKSRTQIAMSLVLTNIAIVEPQEHHYGDVRPLEKRYVMLADCTTKQEVSRDQPHSNATPNQLLLPKTEVNLMSGEARRLKPPALVLLLLTLIKFLSGLALAGEDATALEDFLAAAAVQRSTIVYRKRNRYRSKRSRRATNHLLVAQEWLMQHRLRNHLV
jgi:hypothetical protein